MIRYPDWPERLHCFLMEVKERPFKWGEWDCAAFCGEAVKRMTGEDLYAEMKGLYSSEEEAKELIQTKGFDTYESILWKMLGEPISVTVAMRGDVVLSTAVRSGHSVIGVSLGENTVFVTIRGLVWVPTVDCDHAWKIGHV